MKDKVLYISVIVLSLALAAYCGYAWYAAGGWVLTVIYTVALLCSVPVADFLHEGAHWLVGTCLKMGVRIDNISLVKSSSVTLNPKGDRHLKGRTVTTAAAGLIVNLICVIVGAVMLCLPGQITNGYIAYPSPWIYVSVILPYSFYLFALNALPLQYDGGKTDGLVLWEIIKNDPSAQVMLGVLKVQSIVNAGTPLEEVDDNLLFNLPQLPEDDDNFIALTQLRYEYALAKGEAERAETYRNRLESLKEYM